MSDHYQTLNLHITKTDGKNKYEACIKDSGGAERAKHTFELQVNPHILTTLEEKFGKDINETSQIIKDFGGDLYNTVFGGEISGYFKSLIQQKKDIRLRLVFSPEDGELLRLPWEFIYDGSNFLSGYERVTLTRSLDGLPSDGKGAIKEKLRMLAVISSPLDLKDHERLQVEQEQMLIMEAVDRAHVANRIEIEFLDEASLPNIQDRLDEEEFHILHYTGHGVYNEKEDKGYLILEDDAGKARPVDNETIANLLAGYKSLRLVVLSGCQTAKTSGRRALSDLATPLLTKNIPAVVAMQYSVTDKSAMALAQKLYIEIGNNTPVDLALTRARKALLINGGLGSVEFATPVLYAFDSDCLTVEKTDDKEAGIDLDGRVEIKPNIVLGIEQMGRQYIGRRRELRRIKDGYLQRGMRVVVLHGIGGIGKTVTASRIADMMIDRLHGVYTFDCREGLAPDTMLMHFNLFLQRLGIKQLDDAIKQNLPIEAKIEFLGQVLSQIKLLVIFDNFETLLSEKEGKREIADPGLKKALKTLVTQSKDGSRFLFTSRYTFNLTDGRITNLIDEINMAEMSRPEAVMIMNRFADIANEDFITKLEIYKKIGGHPYTINIFGRHAAMTSAQDVLADLAKVQKEMVEFTLLDKSYKKLGKKAKRLLDSVAVFRKPVGVDGLAWLMKDNGKTPDVNAEIKELIHWGLIVKLDEDAAQYQVHTLVKDFIKDVSDKDKWKKELIKAAVYYEELFETSKDIWDYLESRNLFFEAEEYDKAGEMVGEMFELFHRWGYIEFVRTLNQQTIDTAFGKVKADALFNLGKVLDTQCDLDGASEKYNQCLKVYEELGDKSGIANTLIQLGNIHKNQGDFDRAIEIYKRSQKIFDDLSDKSGIARILHQLGMIHQEQSDYDRAIEKYNQSLKIKEELGDKSGKAYSLGQVAAVHYLQGAYDKAIEKYNDSLEVVKALGDKSATAVILHQLGVIHQIQGDYDRAIEKYNQSLKVAEELGDKSGKAYSLGQLAAIHYIQGAYDKAIEKYNDSLEVVKALDDKSATAIILHQLGVIHQKQGDFDQAIEKYNQSLKMKEELGNKSGIAGNLGQIGRLYAEQKKYKDSLKNYIIAASIFEQLKSPDLKIVQGNMAKLMKEIGKRKYDMLYKEVISELEKEDYGTKEEG